MKRLSVTVQANNSDFGIAMLMDALVKKEAAVGLSLMQVPLPQPTADQVLVRVERSAICGTDLHIYRWDSWAQKAISTPQIIGHEFVGTIVDTGELVTDYLPGDLVSGEGHVVCNSCRNCKEGKLHLCSNSRSLGVDDDGAFAQYMVMPQANVWKHLPGINPDIACLFDPLGNAVHACLQWSPLAEDVLITGAGPIGVMATAVARFAGARSVTVTDINQSRLDLASQLGASATVRVDQQPLETAIQQLDIGDGFGIGLEMSGKGQALAAMVEAMRHGGNIALLGIPVEKIDLNWQKLLFAMITVRGVSGRRIFQTWRTLSTMIASGLDISPVIAMRLPYTDYQKGFDYLLAGGAGKVILDWQ